MGPFTIPDKILVPLTKPGEDAVAGLNVFPWTVEEYFSITKVTFQCDPANKPSGSIAQLDINKNATTIFDTVVSIDAGESHSDTAATAAVLTNDPTDVVPDDVLVFDLDQVGATSAGQAYAATLHVMRPLRE